MHICCEKFTGRFAVELLLVSLVHQLADHRKCCVQVERPQRSAKVRPAGRLLLCVHGGHERRVSVYAAVMRQCQMPRIVSRHGIMVTNRRHETTTTAFEEQRFSRSREKASPTSSAYLR